MCKEQVGIPILMIMLMILISGCASDRIMPVTMNFPEVPEPLLVEPEKLETLPEDANQLSDLLENSTVNYGKYRELQIKYLNWQNWYNTQRLLHKETTGE